MDETQDRNIVVEDEALQEGFTQISNAILRDRSISCGAKVAHGILLSYAWNKGYCYPGQKTMAEDMGVDEDSVNKYLRELIDKGFISSRRRGQGLTNIYTIKSRTRNLRVQETDQIQKPRFSGSRSRDFRVQEAEIFGTNKNQVKKTQEKKTQTPYNPPRDEDQMQGNDVTQIDDSGSRNPTPIARSSALAPPPPPLPTPPHLARFVAAYPDHRRRCNDQQLLDIWNRITARSGPDALFTALEKQKASWKWTTTPQYVPNILKWLTESRWLDPIEPAPLLRVGDPGYRHPQPPLGKWGVDY